MLGLALEERLNITFGADHPIWPFLIEYASFVLSKCEIGHDGKTPYERTKGKTWKREIVSWLEKVYWRPLSENKKGHKNKLLLYPRQQQPFHYNLMNRRLKDM